MAPHDSRASMTPALTSLDARLTAWFMRRTAPNGVRRVASLSAAVATDVGEVREENQDRLAVARGVDSSGRAYAVLALADGIGGMKQGAECAAIALGSFLVGVMRQGQSAEPAASWLMAAAHRANRAVHERFQGGGGSTLVAALVIPGREAHWLSVGDSRVHLARGAALTQLSTDDTIAGQLGKPAEAGLDRSALLQFIGIGAQLEPHAEWLPSDAQGSILLTSDGAHFLEPAWLGRIVAGANDAGLGVRRLVEMAKWCGGPDNASAAMIALDAAQFETQSGGEFGFEIWDPHGDLQVIEAVAPKHAESPAPARSQLPPVKTEPPRATVKAEKPRPGSKPRRGKNRKQKEVAPTGSEASDSPQEDAPTERPQLVIEFPSKVG